MKIVFKPPEAGRTTILVVDDDFAILVLIKAILEEQHYRVLTATDAEAALSLVEQDSVRIDLMLTDVEMPGASGVDLAERARAIRSSLRVVFMSGSAQTEIVRLKVLNHGLGFVAKPFPSDGLIGAIHQALPCNETVWRTSGR